MHLKYVKIINKTASVMDRVLPRLITLLSIPLDPQARSYILKALRQTAAEKVKQKSPCLNPCLRQLETLLAELPHNATGTFNFQNIYFLCQIFFFILTRKVVFEVFFLERDITMFYVLQANQLFESFYNISILIEIRYYLARIFLLHVINRNSSSCLIKNKKETPQ